VEQSTTFDKTLATFNTTFIALIAITDNPTRYEIFQAISRCNSIYKIISKLISGRLNNILSRQISTKQFGILEGTQIRKVVGGSPGRSPLNENQESKGRDSQSGSIQGLRQSQQDFSLIHSHPPRF
jgi:hypothetical protein